MSRDCGAWAAPNRLSQPTNVRKTSGSPVRALDSLLVDSACAGVAPSAASVDVDATRGKVVRNHIRVLLPVRSALPAPC